MFRPDDNRKSIINTYLFSNLKISEVRRPAQEIDTALYEVLFLVDGGPSKPPPMHRSVNFTQCDLL